MKTQRQNKLFGYLKHVPQTHNIPEDESKTIDGRYNIYIEYNLLKERLDKLEKMVDEITPKKYSCISRLKNFFNKK